MQLKGLRLGGSRGSSRGGLLRKPVWAEEDTGNPTGPPKASPGLQGGGPWDRAGLGYHEETQQLFRVVKECSNRRTRLQRGAWRSQEERVRGEKAQSILWGRERRV